jgi:hypothetical protein
MWTNLADSDGDGQNTGPSDPNNLGGFSAGNYWSSTEANYDYAWLQYFTSGAQVNFGKHLDYYVRSVRAF